MAIDQLTVDTAKPTGAKVRELLQHLQAAKSLTAEIVGDFGHLVADPDYSGVQKATTLQDIDGASGDGQVLYNLVAGVLSELGGSNTTQFLDRIGWR